MPRLLHQVVQPLAVLLCSNAQLEHDGKSAAPPIYPLDDGYLDFPAPLTTFEGRSNVGAAASSCACTLLLALHA